MLWVSGRPDGHRVREITAPDGVKIPFREWRRLEARAVILYLHGQGDHSGPFCAMGDHLHEMGYNLFAHDQRGFGLSRAQRGHIPSYDRFLEDVVTMLNHARGLNPGKPRFLLGLSMGGHIALRAAARIGHQLTGVIALSPGLKLRRRPDLSTVLRAGLYALFAPNRYLPTVVDGVVTTRNHTHLERAQQDERWVTAYTARFYLETLRSLRKAWREARQIRTPVLIMHAGADALVSPEESRRFSRSIGHPDVEYRLLDGLGHNLVAEPEMPEIAWEIGQWIDRRIGYMAEPDAEAAAERGASPEPGIRLPEEAGERTDSFQHYA